MCCAPSSARANSWPPIRCNWSAKEVARTAVEAVLEAVTQDCDSKRQTDWLNVILRLSAHAHPTSSTPPQTMAVKIRRRIWPTVFNLSTYRADKLLPCELLCRADGAPRSHRRRLGEIFLHETS
jgi:hypothetical protein